MTLDNKIIAIRQHRNRFNRTNARLRRARRLYCRCVRSAFAKDRTGNTLKRAAQRAQAAGIYSENTALRDVMMSISVHLHKYERDTGRFRSWFHWMRVNGWNTYQMVRYSMPQDKEWKPWHQIKGGVFENNKGEPALESDPPLHEKGHPKRRSRWVSQ